MDESLFEVGLYKFSMESRQDRNLKLYLISFHVRHACSDENSSLLVTAPKAFTNC